MYFIEFLINILFRFLFFLLGNFFFILSNLLNFLAFEKRKYIDYEKMYKKIVTYLKIKRQYRKKGKIYTYISDKIDPNEKSIKSFLRKKKIDIKLGHVSTFFLDLENTFKMDIHSYLNEQ